MDGGFYKQNMSAWGAILLKQQALDVSIIRQGLVCVGYYLPIKREAEPGRRLSAARPVAARTASQQERAC